MCLLPVLILLRSRKPLSTQLRVNSSGLRYFTQACCFPCFIDQRCLLLQIRSSGWDLQESGDLSVWWPGTFPLRTGVTAQGLGLARAGAGPPEHSAQLQKFMLLMRYRMSYCNTALLTCKALWVVEHPKCNNSHGCLLPQRFLGC